MNKSAHWWSWHGDVICMGGRLDGSMFCGVVYMHIIGKSQSLLECPMSATGKQIITAPSAANIDHLKHGKCNPPQSILNLHGGCFLQAGASIVL